MQKALPDRRFLHTDNQVYCWLGVLLGCYLFFCWWHTNTQAGGSDSSGYFNMTRALASGQLHPPVRAVEGLAPESMPIFAYTPLGFIPSEDRRTITPSYPFGMPLFYLAAVKIMGWTEGPRWVLVLHTIAGVWLTFLLIKRASGSGRLALLGAVLIASAPLYLQFAVQSMSDVPATTWCLFALWLAGFRNVKSSLAAGAAVGVATLIRPTNLILIVPVLTILGRPSKLWLALALGGAPFAVALGAFNYFAYGSPFRNGYGNASDLFSVQWAPVSLMHYLKWTPMALAPLVILAPGIPFLWKHARSHWLPHAVWVGLLFGLYAFYYHTHETWWYLRFVLPAMPSLLLLCLLVLDAVSGKIKSPSLRWLPYVAVITACGLSSHYWIKRYRVHRVGMDDRIYSRAVDMVNAHAPSNAIIMAMQTSGALYFNCEQPILRWDCLDGRWEEIRAKIAKTNRPIYALLFSYETDNALKKAMPGPWKFVQKHDHVTLWQFQPASSSP